MDNTISEVLSFVEENDVKFIRLTFCDLFGVPKKRQHHAGGAGACLYRRDFL